MGWRRVAEQELALIKPETRAALEAYADGVNAYVESSRSPGRARRRVHPAPRRRPRLPARAVDARRLAGLAQGDGVGPARQHDRRDRPGAGAGGPHAGRRSRSSTRPTPTTRTPRSSARARSSTASSSRTRPGRRPGSRSGRRTTRRAAPCAGCGPGSTGCPPCSAAATASAATRGWSTASTPRPGRRCWPTTRTSGSPCPGVWMQIGLHCRTVSADCPLDVAGFTFSGVPGVIIGHNADIAWGFTNLGPDVSDLYLERVVGDQWRHDGRLRPLRTRTETIEVRDGDDVRARPSARPPTARCSPTSPTTSPTSASRRRPTTPSRRGERVRRVAGVDGAAADRHRRRDPRAEHRHRLVVLPGGRRRSSRCRRRTWSTPTARATSATRRPAGSRSASPATTATSRPRAGAPDDDWTGDYVPFDGPAERARPRARGSSSPPTRR